MDESEKAKKPFASVPKWYRKAERRWGSLPRPGARRSLQKCPGLALDKRREIPPRRGRSFDICRSPSGERSSSGGRSRHANYYQDDGRRRQQQVILPGGRGRADAQTQRSKEETGARRPGSYFVDPLLRPVAMVSRRKILSRSRDDLNLDEGSRSTAAEEEDIWYQKEKLYKDHIKEVLNKWESIDDEIWAKVIVLERNRRVAKAYARAPVLTINGSEDGFDGFRIGVNGFDNPMRDPKTAEFKAQIGQGCKVKMDETGNILIKRFSKSSVYVKNTIEENAVSNDILKLPNGLLEPEKPFKLFDMKKFQQNVNREMKRTYPDRRKLECQCISTIAFAKNEPELLDSPIWIMLINVVALEMLKAKMPQAESGVTNGSSTRPGVRHSSEPRKRFLASGSSDEDPYSLTPSGSSGSSGKGNNNGHSNGHNTRLPPGDKEYFGPQNWAKNQRPDYSDDMEDDIMANTLSKKQVNGNSGRQNGNTRQSRKAADDHHKSRSKHLSAASKNADDPYYCGLRARVPNFVNGNNNNNVARKDAKNVPAKNGKASKVMSPPPPSRSTPNLQSIAQLPGAAHPFWWHSRLYPDSGLGASSSSAASGQSGYPAMAFRTNELPSYHYPGRVGNRGYGNGVGGLKQSASMQFSQQPVLATGGTTTLHTHRPAVFRTGWE